MTIKYQTKQKDLLLELIVSYQSKPFSAADLLEKVQDLEISPSRATIYRLLDDLEKQGTIRKYFLENQPVSLFQYIEHLNCHQHFHAVCDSCGVLYHIECEEVHHIIDHLNKQHHFSVNIESSVFHGLCANCR